MVGRTLSRYATGVVPLTVLSVLLVVALAMMGAATQNSPVFGHLYSFLLVINVVGIVVLLGLILFNLRRLFQQIRAGVMGSRLTLRLLGFFVVLAVVPVSVVYFFSVEAFSRGIDNWFHVKIERALNDALALGRASLDMRERELERTAQNMAAQLAGAPNSRVAPLLRRMRSHNPVSGIALYGPRGDIIASAGTLRDAAPNPAAGPKSGLFAEALQGKAVADLDPLSHGGLRLRVLVPVMSRDGRVGVRVLQVLQHIPGRYSRLGGFSIREAFLPAGPAQIRHAPHAYPGRSSNLAHRHLGCLVFGATPGHSAARSGGRNPGGRAGQLQQAAAGNSQRRAGGAG
ncbi:MAG: hypothetical protein ACYDB8_07320 [Acidiferrobacterales bacterium]